MTYHVITWDITMYLWGHLLQYTVITEYLHSYLCLIKWSETKYFNCVGEIRRNIWVPNVRWDYRSDSHNSYWQLAASTITSVCGALLLEVEVWEIFLLRMSKWNCSQFQCLHTWYLKCDIGPPSPGNLSDEYHTPQIKPFRCII